MKILGVSFLADASAAVIVDGKLVSAVSQERLNREKLWHGVPHMAIEEALRLAGVSLEEIDIVATHGEAPEKPDSEPYDAKAAKIKASDLPEDQKQAQLDCLYDRLNHETKVLGERTPNYLKEIYALGKPVKLYAHHESHAATAYYGSGWQECTVLTADGWGEDASSSLWLGKDGKLQRLHRSNTFDSLGYFYGSVTKSLGFVPHRHEGKVLGLAAYAESSPSYETIRAMVDYDRERKVFSGQMENGLYVPRFENPALKEFVAQYSREEIAFATQKTLEEVVCACVADAQIAQGRLALAGGIFANVKLNQRLAALDNVDKVFVFPNMGDGGLSIGAAWLAYQEETGQMPDPMTTMYLGTEASMQDVEAEVRSSGYHARQCADIESEIAKLLADGHIVARFDGAMEFGPRALGNRSILSQATDPTINDWLNNRLDRSEFMPFAPASLSDDADELYIGLDAVRNPVRYMTTTLDCTTKMQEQSPAAVHIDNTARPQVVSEQDNPSFYKVLKHYKALTGLSSVINTSFNIHEEPIVCTASDAFRAVAHSKLPYLAIGNVLVEYQGAPVA